VLRAPYPDPYRTPPGLDPDDPGGSALARVRELLESEAGAGIGTVIVEPIQGRGGDIVPPAGFLSGLAELCRERGLLLIADEIYTGFGRTGRWFASEHDGVTPDLLCVGKALSSTLPIAACLGSKAAMDAWPESAGEAKHTSTFLGNPLACAAGVASLGEIRRHGLVERAATLGEPWIGVLRETLSRHDRVGDVRGRGLMIGIDLVAERGTREPHPELAGRVVREALRQGWILLAGGPAGNVISLSPPLSLGEGLMRAATAMLDEVLSETG
jgi:4-aminobutyrate aminotransferase-like enzyme